MSTSGRSAREQIRAVSVPALFLLLAVWISIEALEVPLGTFGMPGAGFFPLGLGLMLAILSVMLWGMSPAGPASESNGASQELREVLYLIGGVFASAWLFERIGFLLTMALFLTLTTRVLGKINWPKSIALALVGSVAAYVVFGRVLQINLPSGILPY